jgi:DNA-binding transcriptional LysR family regulator
VRVGCFSPHIAAFLASVVADFRIAHPHIAVDLVEQGLTARNPVIDGGPSLLEALRAGVIDVITTSAVEDDGDLDGFRAYEVRVVAVTSAAEPTPTRARLSVDALRGVPLVVSPPGYFSRGRLEAACRTAGFEPHVEVESSSPAALLALAEAGVGMAILADDAAPHQRAVTLTAAGQPLTDEVWLYRLASRTDPAAEAFFAHARAAALAGVRPRRSRRPAVDDGP